MGLHPLSLPLNSLKDNDLRNGVELAMALNSNRTRLAQESFKRPLTWGGLVASSEDELIQGAVALHKDRSAFLPLFLFKSILSP